MCDLENIFNVDEHYFRKITLTAKIYFSRRLIHIISVCLWARIAPRCGFFFLFPVASPSSLALEKSERKNDIKYPGFNRAFVFLPGAKDEKTARNLRADQPARKKFQPTA
jgi:hypothetical protein